LDNDITLTGTVLTIPRNANITLISHSEFINKNDAEFFKLIGVAGTHTILVDGGGILKLDGINVTHTTGVDGRGIMVNFGGVLELQSGVISGNRIFGDGGGVFNSGTFRMSGGEISANTYIPYFYYYVPRSGSGVYNTGTFIMTNGKISNNIALTHGGGVFNTGSFRMSGGNIFENTAGDSGGGVYNFAGDLVIRGIISDNKAASGGGVFSAGGSFVLSNSIISSNAANNGGGLYTIDSIFESSNCEISNNNAATTGGGIFSVRGILELSNCKIFNNKAANGGGIYRDGALGMTNVIASNNHASSNGGAIYKDGAGSTLNMYGGTVSGNTAGSSGGCGGGIYINNGNFEMFDKGTISDNTATNGGGVYLTNGLINLHSGKISNNYAVIGGGVWITGGYTNLNRLTVAAGVEFSDNRATTAYNRQPIDDETYNSHIGVGGADVNWSDPFIQGYNNYDISYIRGERIRDYFVDVIRDDNTPIDASKWATYIAGATVRIDARVHPEGMPFKEWIAISGNVVFADPKNPVTTFIMPASSVEINAIFGKDKVTLTSIVVSHLPSKTVYAENELLDLAGLVVTATYNDGSIKPVTNYITNPINGAQLNNAGEQIVTISYTENGETKTTDFSVTVKPHVHVWGEWVVTKAATHSEAGLETRSCECGVTETREIPAGVHVWVVKNVVAPSCVERGFTNYVCSVCGETMQADFVPALGHDLSTVRVDATCEVAGSVVVSCSRCDYETVTVLPALGHHEGVGIITKPPTSTAPGVRSFYCTRCGQLLRTETIPPTGNTISVNGVEVEFSVVKGVVTLTPTQKQMSAIFAVSGKEIVFDLRGRASASVALYVQAGWFKDVDKTLVIKTDGGDASVSTKSLWNNSGKERLVTVTNGKLDFKNI
ncbi:MAG: bacterial Ig-like domain-containing protein, partial [Nitrososphaerota archaeon]|nr:bacterial Ig-like domain-containing protein [Nitrososphaerota archaeon]